MKFAVRRRLAAEMGMTMERSVQLTICRAVHHNETSINRCSVLSPSPWHGVCVATEAIGGLVYVDIVGCAVESPESCYARTAAAHNGYLLPGD